MQLVIERAQKDGSQFESLVTGMVFGPASVQVGASFTATLTGINLNPQTYFDIRFRRPGSTADDIAFNWQQGTSASHAVNTPAGTYTVTGVRAHKVIDDYSGEFAPISATLTVVPR